MRIDLIQMLKKTANVNNNQYKGQILGLLNAWYEKNKCFYENKYVVKSALLW